MELEGPRGQEKFWSKSPRRTETIPGTKRAQSPTCHLFLRAFPKPSMVKICCDVWKETAMYKQEDRRLSPSYNLAKGRRQRKQLSRPSSIVCLVLCFYNFVFLF
jgi:hypothetical protein